jgi:hypothetical protein
MKQYALFLFMLPSAFPFLVRAQNVGIGTTSPQYTFDVRTSENGTVMRLRTAKDSVGATTLLRFTTAANLVALGDKSSYIGNLTSGAGHNLVFGTSANNQAVLEKMRLNYQGFLGLGTTDPTARLYIDMSNTSDDNALIINDDEDALVELRRNNVEMGFWQLSGNDVKIGTTLSNNSGSMILRTNGADRVMVDAAGVVRMGNLNDYYLRFTGSGVQSLYNGGVAEMALQKSGGKLEVGNLFDFATTKLQIDDGVDAGLSAASSGYLMMGLSTGANLIADNNEIQARNNGDASPLYLQNSGGSVYIGDETGFTTSHKLGVAGNAVVTGALRVGNETTPAGYKLAVDGKIICTEVMVRLVPQWPDYVFSDRHKKLPLHKLEEYIRKNKHLPGIPAAGEIEKAGLPLAEMQRLQMEKIEELTLYIIELKKEIDLLKQKR